MALSITGTLRFRKSWWCIRSGSREEGSEREGRRDERVYGWVRWTHVREDGPAVSILAERATGIGCRRKVGSVERRGLGGSEGGKKGSPAQRDRR